MNPKTRARIARVKEELEAGTLRSTIMEKLTVEFGLAPRTIDYFIGHASKKLDEEYKKKEELVEKVREDQIRKAAKDSILSVLEVEIYLSAIIRGDRKEEKVVSTRRGPEVVRTVPRIPDVMKAITLFFNRQPPKRYVFKDGKCVVGE